MAATSETKKWVLIVDDDAEFREMLMTRLQMVLGPAGKYVLSGDGIDATNRLPFTAFDLIITDLNMPKKEGRAFIASARQSAMNQATPIIVVSGDPKPELEKEFSFIYQYPKPLDLKAFNEAVSAQLKLGRTDQRIGADLLNGFLDAVIEFYDRVLETNVKVREPIGKKNGSPLEGDFFRVIDFKNGKAKGQFVVGFPVSALETAHKKVSPNETPDLLKVVETAGRLIFQKALRRIGNPTSVAVTNVQNLKNDPTDANIAQLKKEIGVHIPLEDRTGVTHLYTLW